MPFGVNFRRSWPGHARSECGPAAHHRRAAPRRRLPRMEWRTTCRCDSRRRASIPASRRARRARQNTGGESACMSLLSLILNILWVLTGGLWMAVAWLIAAVLMGITIVGIPWARAAINIANYTLLPFGRVAL